MAAIANKVDAYLNPLSQQVRIITLSTPWLISTAPSELPVLVNITNSTITGSGTTDITLSWNYVQPTGVNALVATEFVIYYISGTTGTVTTSSPILATVPATARSFIMTGVTAGSSFKFGILARQTVGTSVSDTAIVTGSNWIYDGSAVSTVGIYSIAQFFIGKPAANQDILRLPMVKTISLAVNLDGSKATAKIAATATTQFVIKKNGVSFGALTFAAGGTVGTFTSSTAQSLEFGDVLTLSAPAVSDATLEDIGFIIAGLT